MPKRHAVERGPTEYGFLRSAVDGLWQPHCQLFLLILLLGVDSPFFSTIVVFRTSRFPRAVGGFLERSVERMGKLALEFYSIPLSRVDQFTGGTAAETAATAENRGTWGAPADCC